MAVVAVGSLLGRPPAATAPSWRFWRPSASGWACFTPANNAAIMGAVPPQQSGLASGVLNMTRGMGTSLGLALTGLVFDVSGGNSIVSSTVDHAFSVTALALAAIAIVAGFIAGLREGGSLDRSVSARVE